MKKKKFTEFKRTEKMFSPIGFLVTAWYVLLLFFFGDKFGCPMMFAYYDIIFLSDKRDTWPTQWSVLYKELFQRSYYKTNVSKFISMYISDPQTIWIVFMTF